jgi:hypothetical protein
MNRWRAPASPSVGRAATVPAIVTVSANAQVSVVNPRVSRRVAMTLDTVCLLSYWSHLWTNRIVGGAGSSAAGELLTSREGAGVERRAPRLGP